MSEIMKTEYRKVTPEEKLHVSRWQSIVFSFNLDEKEIREKIAKGEYKSDNTYGAIDENGRIIAGMDVIPYVMWFDGQKVAMYGIGGVASAPESRRQGNIRGIFEKAFCDIYEKGAVFSHLYPFSHDYYRKFGYEHVGRAIKYTLSLGPARKLKNNGSAYEFIKGDVAKDKIIEVYETYASRHNNMISRTQERWNEILDVNLFGAERLYYWKDAKNNIKSWAKFKKNGNIIEIQDISWTDHESMLGILQFIGMFEGAAEKMSLAASPEFIPELYWNNLYDIQTENKWLGMNRVVNAKHALELMKKPSNPGKFTIKIVDKFASWNNNTYAVEFGGNDCAVKTTDSSADVETSELALVHMIIGVYDFEQIAHRDDVCVNGNIQTLKQVFYKKPLLIADYF